MIKCVLGDIRGTAPRNANGGLRTGHSRSRIEVRRAATDRRVGRASPCCFLTSRGGLTWRAPGRTLLVRTGRRFCLLVPAKNRYVQATSVGWVCSNNRPRSSPKSRSRLGELKGAEEEITSSAKFTSVHGNSRPAPFFFTKWR